MPVTIADAIRHAEAAADLKDALASFCRSGRPEAKPLGYAFRKLAGRVVAGLVLRRSDQDRDKIMRWLGSRQTQVASVRVMRAAWADLWRRIGSPFLPPPPVPEIDFGRNVVIVASRGTRATGGYAITVDAVRIAGGEAQVYVTEESPASGCIVTQALTAPVAVVAGPRFPGQATFVECASRHECR